MSPRAAQGRISGVFEAEFAKLPTDDALIDRIKWTALARVILLTAVLAFAVVMDLGLGPQPAPSVPEPGLYRLTTAFYLASFVGLLVTHVLRHSRWLAQLALASMGIDVLLALCLVAVTDGLQSVFLFTFPLAVLNSALLLYRVGAVAAASLSLLGLLAVAGLELGWLPWTLDAVRVGWLNAVAQRPPMTPFEIATQLFVQGAAVYATAFLSSHLVRELDRARRGSVVQHRELTRLQVRYADVVSSLPDGLLTVDSEGLVTSINPAGLRILGVTEDEVLERPLGDILPGLREPDGMIATELEIIRRRPALLNSDAPAGQTQELHRGAGQVLACRLAVLREPNGPAGALVVLRDMTGVRAREEAHRNRERLAAIGTMATAVAHEIRNPLASISGAVQMLQVAEGLPPTDRQLMDIVVRETNQLSNWIGEFLDFARPRPLQPTSCDLKQLVRDAIEACRHDPRLAAAGVTLREGPGVVQPDSSLRVVASAGMAHEGEFELQADVALLRQAVWNLLLNAVQAMQAEETRVVEVSLQRNGDAIELAVDDSGPGIAPEDVAHVFEPFYTTKGEGTGLGLATVQRHVAAHRGQVRVEPSQLGGARFVLSLPRRPSMTGVFADRGVVTAPLPA